MKQNEDGKTVAAMDCLVPGTARLSAEAREEEMMMRS